MLIFKIDLINYGYTSRFQLIDIRRKISEFVAPADFNLINVLFCLH